MRTTTAKLGVLFALLLVLCACSKIVEPSSVFEGRASFHLEATPGSHYATYTRFVGIYVYRIHLKDGSYDFRFDGSPELSFELKDIRGKIVAKLEPANEVTVRVTAGAYYLSIANSSETTGEFHINWDAH